MFYVFYLKQFIGSFKFQIDNTASHTEADKIASSNNLGGLQTRLTKAVTDCEAGVAGKCEVAQGIIDMVPTQGMIASDIKSWNTHKNTIQKELGDIEDGKDEIGQLQKAIIKAKMTKEASKKCISELKKLKSMSSMSAEATVIRNYLDWMVELPWNNKKINNINIKEAKKITIAPSQKGVIVRADPRMLIKSLLGRVVVKGDIISLGGPGPTTTLNPGDIAEAEVESIGILRNPVILEI